MNVKEAVILIASKQDLSLLEIRDAATAIKAAGQEDSAEYARLIVAAQKKIPSIKDNLFGMSLDEVIAAGEVVKIFTPKNERNTEEFEKFIGSIENRAAELRAKGEKEQETVIIAKKPRTLNEAERKLLKEKTGIEYPTNFRFDDLTPASKKLLDGDKVVEKDENKNSAGSQNLEDKNKAEKETVVNENDKNEGRKPVVPDQKPYERELEVNEITPEYLNRNYSRLAMFADAANPLDENDAFYASSRDGLDMIDAKDENGESVDIREEIVDTAKLQTIYDLFASKNKVTQEEFNNRLRDNIDILGFTIINADRAATLAETGDTQTMRAEFRNRVDAYLGGGKKQKIDVKLDHVIGTLTAANQQIRQGVNKVKNKFGNIPAVQAFNNRINKVDEKLTKKFGQKYVKAKAVAKGTAGLVTDLGMAALAGWMGPVGMGIYAYYTFNKHALPFLQAAKESGMSYKEYAKAHKTDATMAGIYTASSVLSGVVGIAAATHNVATSAGATVADSLTKFASTGKIVAGGAAVAVKQGVDVKAAIDSNDPARITKSVAKGLGAIALFAAFADLRNHYDLVPHGEHGAVVGPDGHEAAGNTIINNYYNNTENNYYDYSTHDNSTTVIDNCCDPCPDCEPVDVPPTPAAPKIVETPDVDVSGIKDPVLHPVEIPEARPQFVTEPLPAPLPHIDVPAPANPADVKIEPIAISGTPVVTEIPMLDIDVDESDIQLKPAEISAPADATRVVANTKGESSSVDEMFKKFGTEGVTQTANQVDGNLFMDAEKSTAADIKADADSLNKEMQKPLTEIKLETEIKASGEARNPNDMLQHLIAKKQNTK